MKVNTGEYAFLKAHADKFRRKVRVLYCLAFLYGANKWNKRMQLKAGELEGTRIKERYQIDVYG
jgi:hypothetical protein